jgi:hypothetical protein
MNWLDLAVGSAADTSAGTEALHGVRRFGLHHGVVLPVDGGLTMGR